MWKKMAGRLFELQSRNGILEEKDRRLYEYAYGVLLGRVVIYLIIVILGIITGNWMEMIVFLLPFYCFKAVCRRDSFGKGRGLHGCFRYPCPSMQSVSGVCSGCNMANADHMVCRGWRYIYHGAGRCQQQEVGCEREKVYGMRARVILVIECAIAGVFSVIGYSLIVNGIMVAHIVLASGLILGWIKNFFDKELDVTNYR